MAASGQEGVFVLGTTATQQRLSATEAAACAALTGGWKRCPVPTLLGIPLAMLQLPSIGPKPASEQLAVWLTISRETGFAPPEAQQGLGPVLVACTDGAVLTDTQLWELNNYLGHLLDRWGDWMEDLPGTAAEQEEAHTPAAYRRFLDANAEDDDDDDDDEDEYEDSEDESESDA